MGDYLAEILVEEAAVVEPKAVEVLIQEHEAQLINYLKATNIEVGLLLNFGRRPEIRRKVFTNNGRMQEHTHQGDHKRPTT